MDDAKSDENRRGGGARLLALLLALTCTLGWAAAAPHEAAAADADKPISASIDCAPSASYGAKCVVIADYADAHQKVGEVYISSSNDTIIWLTSEVAGVKLIHSYQLDLNQIATMYAGDADCISSDDNKPICYAITLTSKPTQSDTPSAVVQSPTAGAPVSDLTVPALAVGAGLAALGFGLSRRRRA